MAKCTRHFKALMKKNFILWWRTPACSAAELLIPILMMVVLTIIRLQVPKLDVDQEGMLDKKKVSMLGIGKQPNGLWGNSTHENDFVDLKVRPFFEWANYTEAHDPEKYEMSWDWSGPQFWTPSQCLKTFSWQTPT